MALHAYHQTPEKRPTLRVVESSKGVPTISRRTSITVATLGLGVPFVVALIVIGAGR